MRKFVTFTDRTYSKDTVDLTVPVDSVRWMRKRKDADGASICVSIGADELLQTHDIDLVDYEHLLRHLE